MLDLQKLAGSGPAQPVAVPMPATKVTRTAYRHETCGFPFANYATRSPIGPLKLADCSFVYPSSPMETICICALQKEQVHTISSTNNNNSCLSLKQIISFSPPPMHPSLYFHPPPSSPETKHSRTTTLLRRNKRFFSPPSSAEL